MTKRALPGLAGAPFCGEDGDLRGELTEPRQEEAVGAGVEVEGVHDLSWASIRTCTYIYVYIIYICILVI